MTADQRRFATFLVYGSSAMFVFFSVSSRLSASGASPPSTGTLPIEQEWRSDFCDASPHTKELGAGGKNAAQIVVRTSDDWSRLWQALHRNRLPTPPLPEVDFSRHIVIGAFLGERPTGGASIKIASVARHGDELLVDVRTTEPAPDATHTMALTQPCHVVLISAPALPVRFR